MMNHDIFISYSSKQKSIADGVCHYLEENGFKCWMAPRDIPVGSEYGDLIEEAIKSSKVVVLVFSQAASISKWVKGEINVAFTEDKPILPFRVDETEVKGGFRVMLNQMHWIDAFPQYSDRLPDLLSSICGLLGIQARKVDVQSSTTKNSSEKPNQSEKGTTIINGHEYVDLGLPSGTLWATCNVGAKKIEDYGDFFAWGETQPKSNYDWDTYKHCNGDGESLTKYCNKPDFGNKRLFVRFTDKLTNLQYEDDSATVNWGDGWCIPTKKQWEELENCTYNEWVVQDGVKGRLFKSFNGRSLFLPAAGYCWCEENDDIGSKGYYWSSSLDTDYPTHAWYFYFYYVPSGKYRSYGRCNGFSIRPVRSA